MTYYINKTGLEHISIMKLMFIPIIFIAAYFVDKKLDKE